MGITAEEQVCITCRRRRVDGDDSGALSVYIHRVYIAFERTSPISSRKDTKSKLIDSIQFPRSRSLCKSIHMNKRIKEPTILPTKCSTSVKTKKNPIHNTHPSPPTSSSPNSPPTTTKTHLINFPLHDIHRVDTHILMPRLPRKHVIHSTPSIPQNSRKCTSSHRNVLS